jgi:myo-inositol-1(or 4)-monophosphatase
MWGNGIDWYCTGVQYRSNQAWRLPVIIGGEIEQELDRREAFCRDLALTAGRIALEGFGRPRTGPLTLKGPQDFLTETDAAVEQHIRSRVAESFPADGFLGEEGGGEINDGGIWVVDPIDGTANFARQIPHFCISVAYVADARVQLAMICNPALDEVYFARRGRGAERDGRPIRVSDTVDHAAASVELGWSTRVPQRRYMRAFEGLLDQGVNVRRGASGALGLAFVADGRSDGYSELHMHPWDCLAGLLLVEEAGGVVAPFLEHGGLASGGAVLAATPAIARSMSLATGIPLDVPVREPVEPPIVAAV